MEACRAKYAEARADTEADGRRFAEATGEAWFDPIEAGIRNRIRGFIGELLEQELTTALGRGCHERALEGPKGHRYGTRGRQLTGTFGRIELSVQLALNVSSCG